MAYVVVKQNAIARARRVDTQLKLTKGSTLGKMVMLWSESQEIGLTSGTMVDILEWSHAHDLVDPPLYIGALCKVNFLIPDVENDTYIINGQEEELTKLSARKHRSKSANNKRWKAGEECSEQSPKQSSEDSYKESLNQAKLKLNLTVSKPSQAEPIALSTLAPSDLEVGTEWFDFACQMMPWKKTSVTWSPEGFAKAIAKLKQKTDLNDEGVKAVLAFIKSDHFWQHNAISPNGLLKKSEKNGNRKIDNILVRMRGSNKLASQAELAMRWAEGE